jgi:hypothetical protein
MFLHAFWLQVAILKCFGLVVWATLLKPTTINDLERSLLRSLDYEALRQFKAGYFVKGYVYQHSFYYFVKVAGLDLYRRVEVIATLPFTPKSIMFLHELFARKVAGWDYSLWSFDPQTYRVNVLRTIDRRDRR